MRDDVIGTAVACTLRRVVPADVPILSHRRRRLIHHRPSRYVVAAQLAGSEQLHGAEVAQLGPPVSAFHHVPHLQESNTKSLSPTQSQSTTNVGRGAHLTGVDDDGMTLGELVASAEDVVQGDPSTGVVHQDGPVAVLQGMLRRGPHAHVIRQAAHVQVRDLLLTHPLRQGRLGHFVVVPKGGVGVDVRVDPFVDEDGIVHHL